MDTKGNPEVGADLGRDHADVNWFAVGIRCDLKGAVGTGCSLSQQCFPRCGQRSALSLGGSGEVLAAKLQHGQGAIVGNENGCADKI